MTGVSPVSSGLDGGGSGVAARDVLRARETGGTTVGVFLGCCETVGTFVGGNWLFFG